MSDLGQVLIDANVLTEDQVRDARSAGGSLASTLVERKLVSDQQLVSVLTQRFGLEAAPASLRPTDDVLSLVNEQLARGAGCVPLRQEGGQLVVATADPSNQRGLDRLSSTTGVSLKILVATPRAVEEALSSAYGGGAGKKKQKGPKEHGPSLKELDLGLKHAVQEVNPDDGEATGDLQGLPQLEVNELDAPVMRIINGLLLKSLKMGASDLHIEPLEEDLRVRFRIDGCLTEVLRLPGELKSAVASCLKIMSDMDIAEKRVPQDGGIKMALGENDAIDFRVSSLPNLYGEKMVLRVLGTSDLRPSVDHLGFESRNLELVREAVSNPFGMLLVTGPTGSGKTTTLYTILNQLNQPDVNIVTAEDPVEYRLDGITQVNVRPTTGLTFDATLRSFLRQDPDIILVGEMRDYETAAIAVKAALTGHLVLSTLHTNDAPSTVVRLVDMGIEPYLVASAVKLVIAQRLVRRICTECKEDVDLAEIERTELDQATLASVEYMARGKGCDKCNGMGYKGRIPIFEVLSVKSAGLKRAITEGGTEVQVGQIARREGMQTLTEAAIELVNKGITSIDEAVRIVMAE